MQSEATHQHKQKLIEMRTRLLDEIRRLDKAVAEHEQTADLSHVPSHPADRDSEGIETTLAVERTEWQLLKQVEAALERIEASSYGRCHDCGGEIPQDRLDAVPHAICCIACEEKRERKS